MTRDVGLISDGSESPAAGGVTFINLEDETGMVNVVVSVGAWQRFRRIARGSGALIVRGRVERARGVTNLIADHLQQLQVAARATSRDFR